MTEVFHHTLSAAVLPSEWRVKHSSPLFCLDAFSTPLGTTLIARPDGKATALFDGLTFKVDGQVTQPLRSQIPRGTALELPRAKVVNVSAQGQEIVLPVAAEDRSLESHNVLFTVAQEQRAEVLSDWLTYHAAHAQATAALIIHRQTPDMDPNLPKRLGDALAHIPGLETLVIATISVPLGHQDLGPATACHYAPEAPGKAMLPMLSPDPWHATLAEAAILEVARSRFLSKARAVLYCSPSDLLVPTADNVFDVATEIGFLRFSGKRAYPYALSQPNSPRHGEHNCRAFDGGQAEHIWCVAPAKLPSNAFWRQFRVAAIPPAPESMGFTFDRCMAIRHPRLKVGELVPKSSLVEDAELVQRIKRSFGAGSKSPPTPRKPKTDYANDRILIVTTMKNEGPFILEWLAYHRSIGVTDVLVYTNDCTDGTDTMFALLAERGLVEHRENPYRETEEKPQHAAYHHASKSDLAAQADWIICMDVDEYINVHIGDGTLHALFKAVPAATQWSMTWRLFGNADVARFEDKPILEQFDAAAPHFVRKPHQAWGFKTLFRNIGHYKKFGVHRPKGLRPEYLDQINWVNGSGVRMSDKILRNGWRSTRSTYGYDMVTLNHYALRSAESFLVKRDRGRVNHVDRDQGLSYWFRMNHNAEQDRSIHTHLPRFREELTRLLADPEIAAQHAICVEAHRTRIEILMERSDYRALYQDITGERLRRLSRMLHHFGTDTFLEGPDAVPEDFLQNLAAE